MSNITHLSVSHADYVRSVAVASTRWVRGIVGSVVATVLATAVNLATEWKTNWWAWVAVAILTLVGFVIGAISRREPAERMPSLIDARTTRLGWVTQETVSTTVEGTVLEITDSWPDGRETTSRAVGADAVRVLLEFRAYEVSREMEREP